MTDSIGIPSSSSLWNATYNWGTNNNNGNLLGVTWANGGAGYPLFLAIGNTFYYDDVNRLTAVTDTSQMGRVFAYDQYGNRTVTYSAEVPLSGLTPFSNTGLNLYNANNQLSGALYGYDAAGNQTQLGSVKLGYDAENRQTQANDSFAQTQTSYRYDGDGKRVQKVAGGSTTTYVYL